MRNLIFAAVFISLMSFFPTSWVKCATAGNEVVFTDTVGAINKNELHMSGLRFFIAPDVKIYLKSDGAKTVSLKSLIAVGRIERANVYVMGSIVKKIVVLEMRQ